MKDIKNMSVDEMREEMQKYECDKDEPFVFVSYSHRDKEKVYRQVLSWMRQGYNIYIDLDFENHFSDKNWVHIMEKRITNNECKLFVCFRGMNYSFSYAALIELLTARGENASYRSDELAIDVINVDEYKEYKDIPKEEKGYYKDYYKNLTKNMGEEFAGNNNKEREILSEGLSYWVENLNDNNKQSLSVKTGEDMMKRIVQNYNQNASSFFPAVSKTMWEWFNSQELNGNTFSLGANLESHFDRLEIYKKIIDDKKEDLTLVSSITEGSQLKALESDSSYGDSRGLEKEKNDKAKTVSSISSDERTEKSTFINIRSDDFNCGQQDEKVESLSDKDPYLEEFVDGVVINENINLSEFARICEDVDFCMELRRVRKEKGILAQIFDYFMASLLGGCDGTVIKKGEIVRKASYNYCKYVVAKEIDKDSKGFGASQYTWGSNSRKAMRLEDVPGNWLREDGTVKSGKLEENSDIFEALSPETTIGEILLKYKNQEKGFITKNNEMIFKSWNLIKGLSK